MEYTLFKKISKEVQEQYPNVDYLEAITFEKLVSNINVFIPTKKEIEHLLLEYMLEYHDIREQSDEILKLIKKKLCE